MKITIEQLFISCYFPFSFINYINIIMDTFVCNAELCSIKGLLPKRKTKNLLLLNEEENCIILSSSHDLRANLLYFDMWFNKQAKLLYYSREKSQVLEEWFGILFKFISPQSEEGILLIKWARYVLNVFRGLQTTQMDLVYVQIGPFWAVLKLPN